MYLEEPSLKNKKWWALKMLNSSPNCTASNTASWPNFGDNRRDYTHWLLNSTVTLLNEFPTHNAVLKLLDQPHLPGILLPAEKLSTVLTRGEKSSPPQTAMTALDLERESHLPSQWFANCERLYNPAPERMSQLAGQEHPPPHPQGMAAV